jgi:putative ABC transport system permease protein
VSVIATEPDYLHITRSTIPRGRFLTWTDDFARAQTCVLGEQAARKLFGWRDPMGQWVRLGTGSYQVVGILDNLAALKDAGGDDVNNHVFIPLATARARFGDASISRSAGASEQVRVQLDGIAIQMADPQYVIPTAARLENYLSKTHRRRDYQLLVPLELMEQAVQTRRIWTIVMVVIAGISLLVGGVGIMNIMLANVSDRRKEIGTRRALGARRQDILRQFVFESATLTSLGGFAGIGLGYVLARSVSIYAGWPTIITPASIIVGFAASFLVGLVFGLWPASQAARVSPIEALRSE